MKISSKLKEFTKRIKESDRIYFEEQFMYGHREILLNYSRRLNSKLSLGHILDGSIDHGWAYNEMVWKLRKRNLREAQRYVWNNRHENIVSQLANVKAVGAPWLYMLSDLGITPTNIESKLPKKANKVVIFPSHNTNSPIRFNHLNIIDLFASRMPPNSEVTVCLFWLDFCDQQIRNAYLGKGWAVECAGYVSRGVFPDSIQGGRPTFLLSLFEILKDANLVFTNEIATGMFYALSLGAKLSYFTDDNSAIYETLTTNIVEDRLPGFFNKPSEWAKEYFPDIFSTEFYPKAFLDFSWHELGYDAFLNNLDANKFNWVKSDSNHFALTMYSERLSVVKSNLPI